MYQDYAFHVSKTGKFQRRVCFFMLGRPLKMGLNTSNLPDETINDIQTEENLEEIISSMRGGDAAPEDQSVGDLVKKDTSSDNKVAIDDGNELPINNVMDLLEVD